MARGRSNGQAKLFKDALWDCAPATYQPLPSTWDGTDAELVERMLDFYPRKRPKLILDATMNAGRFWVGSQRNVIGLDINPKFRPDVVADNRRLPFKDRCFDGEHKRTQLVSGVSYSGNELRPLSAPPISP